MPVEIAVVLAQHLDAVAETRRRDPLARQAPLLARDRGGRDAAAEAPCSVQRQAAPAAADFEQVVRRLELELSADEIEPRELGFVQRLPRMLERRGRIHHRLVEEQPEEIVAEVVVRGDVAARAGAAVAAECVHDLSQRRREPRKPALQPVERVHVEHEQPHDIDELRSCVQYPRM